MPAGSELTRRGDRWGGIVRVMRNPLSGDYQSSSKHFKAGTTHVEVWTILIDGTMNIAWDVRPDRERKGLGNPSPVLIQRLGVQFNAI